MTRFAETDLLYLDGLYVYAEYAPEAEQRLKLIPPHRFGPPERCYYDIVTEQPGFVIHLFGQGDLHALATWDSFPPPGPYQHH